MKLTEKEKDQIVKRGAEAMSKIIERMSIEMGELEEENKKLKKELELIRKNTRANMETLDLMYGENVDLKKENEELQKTLEHRDRFFSLMRDVLANENVSSYALWDIVNAVVKEECGADDELDEEDLEIVKKFWSGYYKTF